MCRLLTFTLLFLTYNNVHFRCTVILYSLIEEKTRLNMCKIIIKYFSLIQLKTNHKVILFFCAFVTSWLTNVTNHNVTQVLSEDERVKSEKK